MVICHWSIVNSAFDDSGEPNTYYAGDFEIEFYGSWECSCSDSCGFYKKNENYFVFNNATHFNDAGKFIVRYFSKYDSLFIYQRFEYAYGVIFSETEGVIMYDSTRLKDKNQDQYVSYGKWYFRPKDKGGLYQLYLDHKFEGNTVKGPLPTVNRKAAEDSLMKWRVGDATDAEQTKKYIKERNGLGLYVNGIELRIKLYQNGKLRRCTLYFPFLHGEC